MPPDEPWENFEDFLHEIRDLLDDRAPYPAQSTDTYYLTRSTWNDVSQGALYNPVKWKVHSIDIQLTESKSKQKMLKVTYYSEEKFGDRQKVISNQYLCFDKPGYGRKLAEDWWIRAIGNSIPKTSEEAYKILQKIEPVVTEIYTIPSKTNSKYRNVVNVRFGPSRDRPKKPPTFEEANSYLADMFDEILE